MGWKSSDPHVGKDNRIGRHVDVYHTDDRGKRDQPHSKDLKISYDENKTLVRDVNPPSKK
ncbi:MAG: hypothetical protein ACP5QN_02800 [Minisyncoccia bacterium]